MLTLLEVLDSNSIMLTESGQFSIVNHLQLSSVYTTPLNKLRYSDYNVSSISIHHNTECKVPIEFCLG
jgi:hypothetical protein